MYVWCSYSSTKRTSMAVKPALGPVTQAYRVLERLRHAGNFMIWPWLRQCRQRLLCLYRSYLPFTK
jgi:hypothetical protein